MGDVPKKIAERFVATEVDDEVILLRLSDGDIFSMTGTSREIWDRIDGQSSCGTIADALSALHGAARDTVAEDVAGFVAELRDEGLIDLV